MAALPHSGRNLTVPCALTCDDRRRIAAGQRGRTTQWTQERFGEKGTHGVRPPGHRHPETARHRRSRRALHRARVRGLAHARPHLPGAGRDRGRTRGDLRRRHARPGRLRGDASPGAPARARVPVAEQRPDRRGTPPGDHHPDRAGARARRHLRRRPRPAGGRAPVDRPEPSVPGVRLHGVRRHHRARTPATAGSRSRGRGSSPRSSRGSSSSGSWSGTPPGTPG